MVAAGAFESRSEFGIGPIEAGGDHHVHICRKRRAPDRQGTQHQEQSNERSWLHRRHYMYRVGTVIWRRCPNGIIVKPRKEAQEAQEAQERVTLLAPLVLLVLPSLVPYDCR